MTDPSLMGAAWPSNTSCQWSVTLYQTITAVDAVVAVAGALTELTHPNGPKDGALVTKSNMVFKTQ